MADQREQSPAQQLFGDLAPKLAELTTDLIFGDIWEREELSKRDRSLITVAALIALGDTDQLAAHLKRAKDNGLSEAELFESVVHLAFYVGWPRATSAFRVAKQAFDR